MSRLSDKQALFVETRHKLDAWIFKQRAASGRRKYRYRRGDSYRDPRAFGKVGEKGVYGARFSCHKVRLADDLILDIWNDAKGKWEYATKTKQYREIGEKWESLHKLAVWGGRFNDGNHFSFEHDGRR